MTKENFLAFYPQFAIVRDVVIDEYVDMANRRFSDFADEADHARRLFIAHKLTLWAKTFQGVASDPSSATYGQLASSGQAATILSKSVGGVSISKSEGAAVNSASGYGEWKQTDFGLQLIALCKASSAGGFYVP